MPQNLEIWVFHKMGNIGFIACKEIIDAKHVMSVIEEAIAEV